MCATHVMLLRYSLNHVAPELGILRFSGGLRRARSYLRRLEPRGRTRTYDSCLPKAVSVSGCFLALIDFLDESCRGPA